MGGVGGPEGEIALIFAAEIELLLGSFAAPSAAAARETIGLFNLHRNSFLHCLSNGIPCLYQRRAKKDKVVWSTWPEIILCNRFGDKPYCCS